MLFILSVVSYPILCYPMGCRTPGFPVLHCLLEFAQTHVHWVDDTIQITHPVLPLSPPALNLSQHQGKLALCIRWKVIQKSYILVFTQRSWKLMSTKTWMWMFRAVLFTIYRAWKQSSCPSVNEWIKKKKLVYPYNAILFSSKRKQIIKSWEDTGNVKCILGSETSRSEKATYCTIPTI